MVGIYTERHTMNPAKEDVPVAQAVVETRWVDPGYIELLDDPYKKVVRQICVHAQKYKTLRHRTCIIRWEPTCLHLGSEVCIEYQINTVLHRDKLRFYISKAFFSVTSFGNEMWIWLDYYAYLVWKRKLFDTKPAVKNESSCVIT